jgi:hypothetical protein
MSYGLGYSAALWLCATGMRGIEKNGNAKPLILVKTGDEQV